MFFGEVDGCVLDAVAGQNFIGCNHDSFPPAPMLALEARAWAKAPEK